MESHSVLAYYIFTSIADPHAEVAKHKAFISENDIKCRIYISEEGINGQMSASVAGSEAYMQWLKSDPRFSGIVFKIHPCVEHVFPRAIVKYRKQLVALDQKVDLALTGEHVSPQKWKELLDAEDENILLLDVRNDYEWEIGRFQGADLPTLEQFRLFPEYVTKLKEEWDPEKTKVMMYCTGGIRCELYSALMKKEGFETIYQLDGGVINYGLQEGSDHWKGKLFVFDDRMAVPLSEEPTEIISHCHKCNDPSDTYYNCANMDCNKMFLSCSSCAEGMKGCCCETCQVGPRVRVFEKMERPKPFRRKHLSEFATV